MTRSMDEIAEFFGPVIYIYTRAEAIQDGVLIDVTETAEEAGFIYSTAVTSRLWHGYITPSDKDRRLGQSESGRLWDVLMVLRYANKTSEVCGPELCFKVSFVCGGRKTAVELKSHVGPGDNLEPVLTIMLPDED